MKGIHVQLRLSPAVHAAIERRALTSGHSFQDEIRSILREAALPNLTEALTPSVVPLADPLSRGQIKVILSGPLLEAARSHARSRQMALATWSRYALAAVAEGALPWSNKELEVLLVMKSELRHVGVNLNQIARALNVDGGDVPEGLREALSSVSDAV